MAEKEINTGVLIRGGLNVTGTGSFLAPVITANMDDDSYLSQIVSVSGTGELAIASDPLSIRGGKVLQIGNDAGDDSRWFRLANAIPFDPNTLYKLSIRIRKSATSTGSFYLGWTAFDSEMRPINVSGAFSATSSQHYHGGTNTHPGTSYQVYSGYTKGFGASSGDAGAFPNEATPGKMHPNTRYIAPYLITHYNGKSGTFFLDYIDVETPESGSASITGPVRLRSTLGVSGAATFEGTVDVGGALTALTPLAAEDSSRVPTTEWVRDHIAAVQFSNNTALEFATATGVSQTHVLAADPGSGGNLLVVIEGVVQLQTGYTLSGRNVTFTAPAGSKVEFRYGTAIAVNQPADASVGAAQIKTADGAAIRTAIGAQPAGVVDNESVGAAQIKAADADAIRNKIGAASSVPASPPVGRSASEDTANVTLTTTVTSGSNIGANHFHTPSGASTQAYVLLTGAYYVESSNGKDDARAMILLLQDGTVRAQALVGSVNFQPTSTTAGSSVIRQYGTFSVATIVSLPSSGTTYFNPRGYLADASCTLEIYDTTWFVMEL